MEQLWNRGGAAAGKRSALRPGENGLICDERLPPAATGCRLDRMVRRGAPVRVRKRALTKAPQRRHFLLPDCIAVRPVCSGMEQVRNSQAKEAVILLSSWASGHPKVGYETRGGTQAVRRRTCARVENCGSLRPSSTSAVPPAGEYRTHRTLYWSPDGGAVRGRVLVRP